MILLGGKPLLQWTIDAAQASEIFEDRIYVASDDAEILAYAEKAGVQPLRRPETLAEDTATVDDVVKWTFLTLEDPSAMYVLLPTSPFRSPQTIQGAWERFEAGQVSILMSIVDDARPPFWSLLVEGNDILPMLPNHYYLPRVMLPPTYHHDGSHLIRTRGSTGVMVIRPPEIETIDINTPLDLEFAEFLVSSGRIPAGIRG